MSTHEFTQSAGESMSLRLELLCRPSQSRSRRPSPAPVGLLDTKSIPDCQSGGCKRPQVDVPVYSIRIALEARAEQCDICDQTLLAAGPTGYRDEQVICDLCLLEWDPQLGMVLALVAVARSYGSVWPMNQNEEARIKSELMAFARLYDRYSSRFAPSRPVDPAASWPRE